MLPRDASPPWRGNPCPRHQARCPVALRCPPSRAMAGPSQLLSRSKLTEILGALKGRRVAVVGDAMLDVYLQGDVDRISPEAPVPVVRVRERRYALGGAANVANNVAALGAQCELVAAIGMDRGGDIFRDMLREIDADGSALI